MFPHVYLYSKGRKVKHIPAHKERRPPRRSFLRVLEALWLTFDIIGYLARVIGSNAAEPASECPGYLRKTSVEVVLIKLNQSVRLIDAWQESVGVHMHKRSFDVESERDMAPKMQWRIMLSPVCRTCNIFDSRTEAFRTPWPPRSQECVRVISEATQTP